MGVSLFFVKPFRRPKESHGYDGKPPYEWNVMTLAEDATAKAGSFGDAQSVNLTESPPKEQGILGEEYALPPGVQLAG